MANTFEDQARERFGKATAFLSKAQTLLQDDLVARTVLADAGSAVKNAVMSETRAACCMLWVTMTIV